ncbi:MAG: exodeoxyribonuclease VII large subunit [Anaerolineales bacterium]|nr:exodeoxyribonuclease VII large subunit [Anaerolineales bacterium]
MLSRLKNLQKLPDFSIESGLVDMLECTMYPLNMKQSSFFSQLKTPLSVEDLTKHVRDILEGDSVLQDTWVRGEISNLSIPASGHLYFTLKDTKASIRCVMWRTLAAHLFSKPQDGDSVEVHGSVSVYEAGGQYQLYVDNIQALGQGLLYQEFLRLKTKLEDAGVFSPDRKKQIPTFPKVIGIVTSPSGAALQDMLNTIRRRCPLTRVVLSPASVQGESAPEELIQAIHLLEEFVRPDCILIARGGGSIEDLWSFNNEELVYTISNCSIPIISGVGHETDFTLTDFAADQRAPTPTAAAELATPEKASIINQINEYQQVLFQEILGILSESRQSISLLKSDLKRLSPQYQLQNARQKTDELIYKLFLVHQHHLTLKKNNLEASLKRLHSLNPISVLARGYSIVEKLDGSIVSSKNQLEKEEALNIHVRDGSFQASVTSIQDT